MPFEFVELGIKDVYKIKPKAFGDGRGYFVETYKSSDFQSAGINVDLKQDNQSFSVRGTLRGLHFQKSPYAQGKLVRVVKGRIFDVGVDLRQNSKTYGQYVSAILSGENMEMLWIPEGFAHGFQALEDSIVLYKTTSEYHKERESGVIWNDPDIKVQWPEKPTELSEKDKSWPRLSELK